jgi:2-methylisocitrate lyase-like PEP mutase family enzyme
MRGDHLRARLANRDSVLMPGVWDSLSAKLAVEADFDTMFVSGYCVSATMLGKPDFGFLTQTEMAEVARRVCAAAPNTSVVVDADTGYGGPLNAIRTVELWEQAGAAGMFLEDQVWP